MIYKTVLSGTFLSRPNRFIAHVKIGGETHVCHVKNTGRCRELLVPGAEVYLEKSENPARKTLYDLIAVKKGKLLINMDSQAPNKAAAEALPHILPGLTLLRPEQTFGNSRFDVPLDKILFVAVFDSFKGVRVDLFSRAKIKNVVAGGKISGRPPGFAA